MNSTTCTDGTVRQRLASATNEVHEALHHHPVLGSLLAPDLPLPTYLAILLAYRSFFAAVEERRSALGAFRALTLRPQVEALDQDLGRFCLARTPESLVLPWLDTPAPTLGALYVLHGAGFGGRVLARHVARSQPDAPRRFLATGPSPTTWRALEKNLELVGTTDYAALERGAQQAFSHLARRVSEVAAAAPRTVRLAPISHDPA